MSSAEAQREADATDAIRCAPAAQDTARQFLPAALEILETPASPAGRADRRHHHPVLRDRDRLGDLRPCRHHRDRAGQDRADRPHQDHPAAGDRHRLGDPCAGRRPGHGRPGPGRTRPHGDAGRAQACGAGSDREPARRRAPGGAARQLRAPARSRAISWRPPGASEAGYRADARRRCWRRPPSSWQSSLRSTSRSSRSVPKPQSVTATIAKIDASLPLVEETADDPAQGDGDPVRQPHRLSRRPDPPGRPAERAHRAAAQAGRDRGRPPGAGAAARADQGRVTSARC